MDYKAQTRIRARHVCLALFFYSCIAVSHAQTIRPVRSEYRVEANGSFDLVNDTFSPVNIVLEPQSFTVSETGEISYRSLDPGIQIKFSASSFRIPPKQSYTVSYKAKANKIPAWFVIYANFSNMPVRTSSGMNIVLKLPHTVYILPKKDAAKSEIKAVVSEFDRTAKKVRLEVRSESQNFARVMSVQLEGGKSKRDEPGFPVYPLTSRKIEVDWNDQSLPTKAVLQFENYRIDVPIQQR